MVNIIKSNALNTRRYFKKKKLCSHLDSEYDTLVVRTEVRWFSNGNIIERLFSLNTQYTLRKKILIYRNVFFYILMKYKCKMRDFRKLRYSN